MPQTQVAQTTTDPDVQHVDVLIVGAGISGLGAAWHLLHERPGTTFTILEAQETYGGTWWTHRYPGTRSDSDLFTFGYKFKPWKGHPIATAEEILNYLGEVIEENSLDRYIHYNHRIVSASWDTDTRLWTLRVTRLDTGAELSFTCNFLWMCQGYYQHDGPYTPEWEGMADFQGRVVHPQKWPADLDYAGKRVVVIGSGATAATLIPAMADDAAHVTMLQRTPTFFFVRPNVNELAETLRELDIPDEWTHEIVRRKIVLESDRITKACVEYPEEVRQMLLDQIRPLLPEGFDIDRHFNPPYRPWQQRIAVLPGGDLFEKVREGKVSVVTDTIDRFTESGIRTTSGEELEADIIITATGFNLSVLGEIDVSIDEQPLTFADTVTYRGIMFTGIPNLAYVFGYFRASWTLRADLISEFVCRLLAHMDERGATMVVPALRDEDADMPLGPWVDPQNFNPGYLTRSLHRMPKQGDREPWRLLHEYAVEKEILPQADLEDGTLVFK